MLELTPPYEENMKSWHTAKFRKYYPLYSPIKVNSCSIHFFDVEEGVEAYMVLPP